jgi:hypothetical protein
MLLTCHYCDHKWDRMVYTKASVAHLKCPKCGDSNLTAKTPEQKVDYYAGQREPEISKPDEEPDYDTYL